MSKITKFATVAAASLFFNGCELNNQEMTKVDGQDVDKRFFDSQAINSEDSAKTKELKSLLLNKKWYRVYPYSQSPYVTKFSNYFDSSGAQKSANIDADDKEYDITFEQFVIKDYHISIKYYKPVECDFQSVVGGTVTLKCSNGTWRLVPTLEEASENMSDCNVE